MAVSVAGIPAGATILSIGSGNITISANATANGNAANFFATQQLNMSGALSGAGPISKDGPGRVVLSGPNTTTYAGNYTNLNGFTQLATLTGLGATTAVGSGADITITGGTFYYGNATGGNVVHDLTLNGGTLSAGGNNHTYSGNVNVAAASSINMRDSGLTTAETTGRNITLSGLVSGNASLTVDSVTTASGVTSWPTTWCSTMPPILGTVHWYEPWVGLPSRTLLVAETRHLTLLSLATSISISSDV